jgi:hypothetical protein
MPLAAEVQGEGILGTSSIVGPAQPLGLSCRIECRMEGAHVEAAQARRRRASGFVSGMLCHGCADLKLKAHLSSFRKHTLLFLRLAQIDLHPLCY